MKWAALEIARFVRGAGFAHEDIAEVTALAIATSGGIDTYDFRTGLAGCGHYVGLWGVDVDRWPGYATADLHVPQHAAQAAYDLTRDHGDLSWSPVHATGHHVAYVAHAGTEATREYHAQRPGEPVTLHRSHDMISEALASMQRGVVAASHLRTGRQH